MKTTRTWLTSLVVLGAVSSTLWLAQPAHAQVSADVKASYEKNCKKCHGWDGKGQTAQGKKLNLTDLTTADYQKKATDEGILKVILEGKTDPADSKRKMKGYKEDIPEAQAKELVKVVRAFGKAPGPFPGEK